MSWIFLLLAAVALILSIFDRRRSPATTLDVCVWACIICSLVTTR